MAGSFFVQENVFASCQVTGTAQKALCSQATSQADCAKKKCAWTTEPAACEVYVNGVSAKKTTTQLASECLASYKAGGTGPTLAQIRCSANAKILPSNATSVLSLYFNGIRLGGVEATCTTVCGACTVTGK